MRSLLELSCKGGRDYLHGSDIFNALKSIASIATDDKDAFVSRLIFRHFAKMACELTTEPPSELATIIAEVKFFLPNWARHIDGWLVLTDLPILGRKPFDEDLLVANASYNEATRSASLQNCHEWTPIEKIIALTKYLNYSINPLSQGKWVFGQLDLKRPLNEKYSKLEIRMINLIPGRYSFNNIFIDNCEIGSMRFIVSK
jgi:hypothetical protein